MRTIIYLAGNITLDPRTFEWREEFERLVEAEGLHELHDIEILNPAHTEFDKDMLSGKLGGPKKALRMKRELSQNIFRPKDYQLVKSTTLIVVNLDIIDQKRPIIGTVQELCWARDIFYIPVIGIVGESTNIYCRHPWILECLSAKVKTVADSVEMVTNFIL